MQTEDFAAKWILKRIAGKRINFFEAKKILVLINLIPNQDQKSFLRLQIK